MKYMWLLFWIFAVFAGTWLHTLAPSNWWYIIGFTTGALSQTFLMLSNDERD